MNFSGVSVSRCLGVSVVRGSEIRCNGGNRVTESQRQKANRSFKSSNLKSSILKWTRIRINHEVAKVTKKVISFVLFVLFVVHLRPPPESRVPNPGNYFVAAFKS